MQSELMCRSLSLPVTQFLQHSKKKGQFIGFVELLI